VPPPAPDDVPLAAVVPPPPTVVVVPPAPVVAAALPGDPPFDVVPMGEELLEHAPTSKLAKRTSDEGPSHRMRGGRCGL